MKKCKFLSVVAAGIMAAAMLMTGCGAGGSDTTATNTMFPGTTTDGVTINFSSEPPGLNSVTTTDTISFQILRHIKDGLLMLDENDNAVAATAESWEISDDGLTYTFHLRSDAVWNDGTPVTSNDFKYAWMLVLDPSIGAEYNYMGYYIKNGQAYNEGNATADEVGISCPDDQTLVVELESVCPYFLGLMTFPTFYPVKEGEYSDTYATEADEMSYNGMYILSEWVHNDKCVFTKNEQYYDADSCKLDTWTGIMLTDASAQVNAFEAGQLDMTALTGEQVTAMESTYPGVNIESYADGSVWALMFNMQDDIMSNFYIRKALAECVDRASFITNVRKDQSEVYMHWTYGNLSINGKKFSDVWTENTAFNDADTEAAAEDWAKGCEELGISTDTVLEYLTDDGESAKLYAEYVQGCAASAGITLTIKAVPFKERLANQTAGTYQMSMYGWGQDYDDPQTFLDLWVTGGGNNKAFFSDAEYDSLVEIMNTSTDADEREAACIRAEEIIDEQIVVAPIYSRRTSYVVSAKLGGMIRTVQQDWSLRFAYINE